MVSTIAETREQMCRAIVSFGAHCSLEEVSQALDLILDAAAIKNDPPTVQGETQYSDAVSPLMLACDKDQEACIEWILNKTKDDNSFIPLLGNPLDHAESGNTAMHYAANSCCLPAVQLLCEVLEGDEEKNPISTLVSQRNDNLDTPVMIAALRGHVTFLRQVLHLLAKQDGTSAKELFELANNDGDTALSIACGHGHVEIVNFLLHEAGVSVTYNDMKDVEQSLKRIDQALESLSTVPDQHRTRRNNVRSCLVILKVELAKLAEANTQLLLAEEDEKAAMKKGSQRKKPKGNTKRSSTCSSEMSSCGSDNGLASSANTSSDNDCDVFEEDGVECGESQNEMVSTGGGEDEEQPAAGVVPDPTSTSLPTGPTKNSYDSNLDVDAIIEALCLDTSMLLLGPQDMANLSPCQLDAVAAVLRNQIHAVKEARTIQAHLRGQSEPDTE